MNPQQQREYWQVFDHFRKSRETLYAPKIARVLNAQKAEFIDKYKNGITSGLVLNAAPLVSVIETLYYDAGIVFGAKVLTSIKRQKARMPIGFNARMQQLIEQYYVVDFLNESEGITDTTRELLQKVLTDAQAEGLGFDDTIKLLEGTELSRNRSRLIARTEVVTASNSGGFLSAQESGILVFKSWIWTSDSRTRHDHRSVSSEPIPMDKPHIVGGVEMLHPGIRKQPNGLKVPAKEVVNCRCVEAYVPQRDASGRVLSG